MSTAAHQIWREQSAKTALRKLSDLQSVPEWKSLTEGRRVFSLEFVVHTEERVLAEFNMVMNRADVIFIRTFGRYESAGFYNIVEARNFYRSLVREGFTPAIYEEEEELEEASA